MPDAFWTSLAAAAKDWISVVGMVVGGVWAVLRFGMRRENQTALAIDLTHTRVPYDGGNLVFFDVSLENTGSVKLGARRNRCPSYKDEAETIAYAADLLLRPVPSGAGPGSHVRWFDGNTGTSPRPGDIEVDLVSEYEIDGGTDFWMEPGETSHLGAAVVLGAGSYLAMVTFVGERGAGEFWRRVFLVQVP